MGKALSDLAGALGAAVADKLVSTQTARRVFLTVAGLLGVEIDAQREADLIDQERTAREAKQAQQLALMAASSVDNALGVPGAPSPKAGASKGVPTSGASQRPS